MFEDISRVLKKLIDSEKGKIYRNLFLFGLALLLFLTVLNRYLIVDLIDLQFFLTRTVLARLLFFNGISPYSSDIQAILSNYFSSSGLQVSIQGFHFRDPIYQLFFFFPFTIINDPTWASSLWLTINQFLVFVILEAIYSLFDWKPSWKFRLMNAGITFTSFLGFAYFKYPDFSIVQMAIFLMALNLKKRNKFVSSGLFLGLATLNGFVSILPLIFVIAFLVSENNRSIIVWSFISIVLLSLAGFIFDNNWLLKIMRNLFLEAGRFPFINYNNGLINQFGETSLPQVLNFIPLVLAIWLILEWIRMPKKSNFHLYWLISFGICLNPILAINEKFQPSFQMLLVYLFIIFLWLFRSGGKVKYYLLGIFLLLIVILPFLDFLFPERMNFFNNSIEFNLLNILLTVLMLYWVRWWIIQLTVDNEIIDGF